MSTVIVTTFIQIANNNQYFLLMYFYPFLYRIKFKKTLSLKTFLIYQLYKIIFVYGLLSNAENYILQIIQIFNFVFFEISGLIN